MIAPERRLATLVELIAEITHHEIDGWHATGGSDGAFAQLRPRAEVEERFHGIGVELYPSGCGVYGTINVVPRDQGLLGVVQAAGLAESRSQVRNLKRRDPDEARGDFEPFLLPYVNDLRTLPIPARRVESVESLPLPGHREAKE